MRRCNLTPAVRFPVPVPPPRSKGPTSGVLPAAVPGMSEKEHSSATESPQHVRIGAYIAGAPCVQKWRSHSVGHVVARKGIR
jgi:hypothetical protein